MKDMMLLGNNRCIAKEVPKGTSFYMDLYVILILLVGVLTNLYGFSIILVARGTAIVVK